MRNSRIIYSCIFWAVKLSLSLFLIFYLIGKADSSYINLSLAKLNKFLLLPLIFLLFFQVFLAVIRWKWLISSIAKKNILFSHLFMNYYSASFIGNFFPGILGVDFYRFLFLKKEGVSNQKNLSILIADRIFLAFSCFFTCYLSLGLILFNLNSLYFNYFLLATFFCLTVFFLASYFLSSLTHIFLSFFTKFFLYKYFIVSLKSKFISKYFINISFSLILNAFFVFLLLTSLGLHIPFLDCMFLSSSIFIVSAIPFSISGWGVREFYLIKILPYYHIDLNAALVFSFFYGFSLFLISIPAAFFLNFSFFNKKRFFKSTF